MEELNEINRSLVNATELLDKASTAIAGAELIEKAAWLRLIGEAMGNIFELQHGIYNLDPSLRPAFLDGESKDKQQSRALGQILIGLQPILASNRPLEALKILEDFISSHPPAYLLEAANYELQKIRENFHV